MLFTSYALQYVVHADRGCCGQPQRPLSCAPPFSRHWKKPLRPVHISFKYQLDPTGQLKVMTKQRWMVRAVVKQPPNFVWS